MSNATERLIFVDSETTGLIPVEGFMLELGMRITDLSLNTIDEKYELIWSPVHEGFCKPEKIDPFVWDMHVKSGLWEAAKAYGRDISIVMDEFMSWLETHGVTPGLMIGGAATPGADPMVGSSVQFDREWITFHMEPLAVFFSYRNIDSSTIKELCRRYNPAVYERMDEFTQPQKLHRVESDLTDTIEEFGFYLTNFIFDAVSSAHH